jgi:hypothetical protein
MVIAEVGERVRRLQPLATGAPAELPQVGGVGALVAMNQVVEVELVDLTGIQLREAVAHVLQQRPELFLVVGAYEFPRRSSLRLLLGWQVRRRHTQKVQAESRRIAEGRGQARSAATNVAPGVAVAGRGSSPSRHSGTCAEPTP